jgi:sugar phosphate isomerase/epimerase
MKLSICTDVMGDLSFTDMLDRCVKLGVEGIEMTGGGWSRAPHFRADRLLADKGALKAALKEIEARGLEIAALNCSANPLDPGPMGERHRKEMEQTIRLAGEIGVKTIVTMSGLPAAAPGDTVPNWLVYTKSWPEEMPERDRYQWADCAIPYWRGLVELADEVGVEKYALENFSAMLVWNPETLFRLRDAVGPKVGMNLDPSHLMWMGADPIASARALGKAIHHCHGKDPPHRARPGGRERPFGAEGGHRRRQPHLELRRRGRRPRPAVVEGVFLRRPDDGLQRLGEPRDGRFHHVHRGRRPVLRRCAAGDDQPLTARDARGTP